MRLKDKVAIVTGGARGIGAGIARCLAAEGARLALIDVDAPEAEATAAQLAGGAIGLAADASEEGQANAAVEQVVQRFGGLDILVSFWREIGFGQYFQWNRGPWAVRLAASACR